VKGIHVQIDERTRGDVVMLDLHGKITAGDLLIKDTIQSLAQRGVRRIVLNFADVPYMDSVGLSTLVRSHLVIRQHAGRFVLLHVPRHITQLLTLTGLAAVFATFDDESAAIRSFGEADVQTTPAID
jgi:anti-sigma B factor antagonist